MSNFVDEAAVCVQGGDGGAGCVSFRREAHVSQGGPDGGDGGGGGSVWFIADHNVASLLAFRDHPHRRGSRGVHGQGKKKHGARGDDLEVMVPEGTIVRDHRGEVLADLAATGDRYLAAPGGSGGRGNARFLTNRRRAPTFAEQGEHTTEEWLRLELKLFADVALVGFPNVGKSTLISRISAARPKIADYPFTTLEPNLGVVRLDDAFEMVVADIPGLIEGASEGKGLGHQFLRHVERARVLLILVDLAPYDERGPRQQEHALLEELRRYRPELLDRPRLVVGTKADLVSGQADRVGTKADLVAGQADRVGTKADLVSSKVDLVDSGADPDEPDSGESGDDGFDGPVISSVTGVGINQLVGRLAGLVADARATEETGSSFVVHRPAAREVAVMRADDGGWRIEGRAAERAVALNDLTNPDALDYVQERLAKLGVPRALARAGAERGDTVWIGELSFDYEPDT